MNIQIYQIAPERDEERRKFLSLDSLERITGSRELVPESYDRVFTGDVDCKDLEEVFVRFNLEGHPLHRGHALSVSDVVETEEGAFYCDSIGFQKVDFDASLAREPGELLRVLYVEPGRAPFVSWLAPGLEAAQRAVGGLIEPIYNGDGTCLVGNEEAKLLGMPGNRRMDDGRGILAGAFFICGLTEEGDFRGLSEEEVVRYMDRFAQPEQISQAETQADMGFIFYSL